MACAQQRPAEIAEATATPASSTSQRPKVVIVGAGFGGLAAAKALRSAEADVMLIDRTNHHLFQPLLYQVATAALSPADVATAIRSIVHNQGNLRVVMGDVVGIDPAGRQVRVAELGDFAFDFLVVATGAEYSLFGHDDWARNTWVLKTLEDATEMRGQLLGAFERAESHSDPDEVSRLLTVAIVGGGPTGVELAGAVAELARSTLARDFKRIDPTRARIILLEAGPTILASFPKRLRDYALDALRQLRVEVRVGTRVSDINEQGLLAADEWIEAATVLWAAGTKARPAAHWLGVAATDSGMIKVGPDCAIPGLSDVFAIGDVANQRDASGRVLPGLAAVAKQQGRYVGQRIAANIAGRHATTPFTYSDLGTMAVIGRARAVAALPGASFTGTVAWLLWSLVHLFLLVDFRSRRSVYLNWSWSWLTYGRGARLITYAPPDGK